MNNPNKCYDLKDAAHLFGISEMEFYKTLRGQSQKHPLKKAWINAGTTRKDPERNKPYQWTRAAGFLTTVQRKRPSVRNKKLIVTYVVTVITRTGIHELETLLNCKTTLPPLPALTAENAAATQQQPRAESELTEREKCLQELAAMGIPVSKAS